MQWGKVVLVSFIAISPLQAFVLDHVVKKSRSFCGKEAQDVTAVEESIARGQCEPFMQGVGQISVITSGKGSSGTGILIAPDVVLTAAHVVKNCLKERAFCMFNLPVSTQYAGEIAIQAPIAQTFIPKAYLDLSKRIEVLEGENENLGKSSGMGLDESLAEHKLLIMTEITTYQKAIGDHDIALVRLASSIEMPSYVQIYPKDISKEFKQQSLMFGGAFNKVKNNSTGGYVDAYSKDARQLGIFQIDLSFKEATNPLVASYGLPLDYHEVCRKVEEDKNGIYPDRFTYHGSAPFLTAIVQPGDSGGPLISKVGGTHYIVGVAQQINYTQCYNKESSKLHPGGTFYNVWTPTYNHLPWIKDQLSKMNALKYQFK